MSDQEPVKVREHSTETIEREVWGTRLGFILAAVGSAVGLGNMWRFPYVAAEGGGAAFVFLYIVLTLLVGIPIMLSEFALGRNTRLSPIGALRAAGGKAWVPLGFLFVLAGFLILSYYSVIAGWVVRYAVEAIISGFPANPGEHFGVVSSGTAPIVYHVAFMILTMLIVMLGVEKGIEKAALILIPSLFLILIGLAFWAATLDGAGDGYGFYLMPSFGELLDAQVFKSAAAQAFFSLSLGMGAMLTFSSYLSKEEDLNREAGVVAFSDFGVAFIAGLVVFPVIFALGLQDEVGASTVGALFISLPGAFVEMGALGRVVGTLFFLALAVGAITSAISLLEVVVSSIMDEWKLRRKAATIGAGTLITIAGIFPARDVDFLGVMDKVAGELFLVVGALGTAILVGWVMKNPAEELQKGASPAFARLVPAMLTFVRYVVPPIVAFVLFYTLLEARDVVMAFLVT